MTTSTASSITITAYKPGRSKKQPEHLILLRSLYGNGPEHQAAAAKARKKLRECGYTVKEDG